jgi:Zn-dependent protease
VSDLKTESGSLVSPEKAAALARFTSEAQQLEQAGNVRGALERWRHALALLPKESAQAVWLREHINALETAHPQAANRWVKRLGPLAPIALFLAKFKFLLVALLKFKFLFSLLAFFGFYWAIYGPKFGIGFALLVLIHEMGHYIDVKRRGLPAEMPVFLPGIGAYVRWQGLGVTVETRAEISLAGPFAGLLASAACAAVWWYSGGNHGVTTPNGGLFVALAAVGGWLNALNLIPVFILDGGQAVLALNRTGRLALVAISVAIGYMTGQLTFYLIAVGAAWRVYTAIKHHDEPQESSTKILFFYTVLLVSLAGLMYSLPSHGAFNR